MKNGIDELKQVLNSELELYKSLLDITVKKTDIIMEGRIKELDSITQLEQSFIIKIGKYEDTREKVVRKIASKLDVSIDTSEISISKILNHIEDEDSRELDNLKNQIIIVLEKLKEKNTLNSMLIKDSLEYINFNLNILTDSDNESTYSNSADKGKVKQSKNLFDAKV